MIPALELMDVGAFPWVDLLVVLLLLGYAISGLRSGLLTTGFALVGFIAGGVLALAVLPQVRDLLPRDDSRPWVQPALVMGLALLTAVLGQLLGGIIGARLKRVLTHPVFRVVDAAGGLVVAVLTAALGLWLVAGAARTVFTGNVASAIGHSVVLPQIDRHMPSPVIDLADDLRQELIEQGLPQVFRGFGPEPIRSVAPPSDSGLDRAEAATLAASVARVDGQAAQCRRNAEGSGWVFAPERVVTNAHVVAGAEQVQVTVGGTRHEASVVTFDPARDVAVLRVPGLQAPVLPQGGDSAAGAPGVVAGFPLGGDFSIVPVRVRDTILAEGRDIFGAAEVTRSVLSLRGVVQPGNSGGPVVDTDGRVFGLVFARSLDDPETGYALTLEEIQPDLAAGTHAVRPVSTQACSRL